MPSRRSKACLPAVACASVIAFAGCGGSSADGDSPLDNALGYLPEDAPLVAAIDTDAEGDQFDSINKIIDKFAFGDAVKDAVRDIVEQQSGDYDEIKPLLGNEFVVGATNVGALTGNAGDEDFVGAIQAKDEGKLEKAIEADKADKEGEKGGATLYKDDDGDFFAIKDDVLVVAGTKKLLESALDQRDADDRLREDDFDETTEALPKDALLRVGGDVEKLLADDPGTKEARRIKWVGALRTFGVTISFEDDEANVGFRLNTDPGKLTEKDLPITSGPGSPSIVDRANDIVVGVKDPTQLIDFAEAAAQAVDPGGFGDYDKAKRTIEKQLDLDIENDLLAQLEGDLSISVGVNGKFGARTQVKDPKAFDRTLAKLGQVLPEVAESATGESVGYAKPKRGGDFYALATASGDSIVYGVIDGVFVLANDAKTASRLSSDDTKAVPDAQGSVVLRADAAQLVQQLLGQLGGLGLAGAALTGPLGDLTGSMTAERTGIGGNFRLRFE